MTSCAKSAFVIRPVRRINESVRLKIANTLEICRKDGWDLYDPFTDTDQDDPCGIRICRDNCAAIKKKKEVWVFYDSNSEGSLFDKGMAFAFKKPFRLMNRVEPTPHKSFVNVLLALDIGRPNCLANTPLLCFRSYRLPSSAFLAEGEIKARILGMDIGSKNIEDVFYWMANNLMVNDFNNEVLPIITKALNWSNYPTDSKNIISSISQTIWLELEELAAINTWAKANENKALHLCGFVHNLAKAFG